MLYNVSISDIMTTNVITVNATNTMDKVKGIMEEYGVHHVPVVDDNKKIIGIISTDDLNKLYHNLTFFHRKKEEVFNEGFISTVYAKEAMTKNVATLRPDTQLGIAVGIFKENLFHAIPVVDEENTLVGILTTYDLINYAYSDQLLINP